MKSHVTTSDAPTGVFGKRINALRTALGLTLQQLTERCGFSATYCYKVESGELLPHDDMALTLAGALHADYSELLQLLADARRARQAATQERAARRRALASQHAYLESR